MPKITVTHGYVDFMQDCYRVSVRAGQSEKHGKRKKGDKGVKERDNCKTAI